MSNADRRQTTQSQTIPLRPMLGIHRDVSPTLTPVGAFFDAEGYIPLDTGLARRFGFRALDTEFPDVSRWDYLDSFINDQGVKITFGLANGIFFELGGSGFIEKPNVYPNTTTGAYGTADVTANSRIISGTGTTWLDDTGAVRGDKITIVATGETFTIDEIIDNITIRIFEIPTITASGSDYEIQRRLTPAADWVIQVVRLDRILHIVTGKNTVMCYNLDSPSNVYTYWEMNTVIGGPALTAPTNFIPKTIDSFKDRIWTGNIYSDTDSRWYTNRVSWTPILNPLDYQPELQYNDIVSIGGEVTALRGLNNMLMVYFEFGLQFGRETAVPGDTLPLAFDDVETARRGVLQPSAVASAVGGHFFASTDNVYFIGTNLQAVPVAENAKELLFRGELDKTRYKVGNLYESEGIYVAASTREQAYEEVWAYNFSIKEWTKFEVNADYVTVFALGSRITYADYPVGQIYSSDPSAPCTTPDWSGHVNRAGVDPNWLVGYDVQVDDLSNGYTPDTLTPGVTMVPFYRWVDSGTNEKETILLSSDTPFTDCQAIFSGSSQVSAEDRFYITSGRSIYVFDVDQQTDYTGAPIMTLLETGDFDFGMPDSYKTFYKLALRLDKQARSDISFSIQASNDSGVTWYSLGSARIRQGGKEGRCNFLHTGSAARFRISSSSEVESYTITEVTVDVRKRGKQFGDF